MKRTSLLLVLLVMVLSACTTSRSTVASSADLNRYKYAAVINNDTYRIPAELMEYEIQLYDAVEESRLNLVSDMRIYDLTQQQRSELLLVKYGISRDENETMVTVNFIDYDTGRPIASCRGTYPAISLTRNSDLTGAIKNLSKQIAKTFSK